MNKRLLFLSLFFLALINICKAQASARTTLPVNPLYDGSEQLLQFTIQGVSWTYPQMKTYAATLGQISGVVHFNPVISEGQSEGYFELSFKAASKADFQQLLREVFCALNIQHVQLNETTFENCHLIVVS